MLPPISEREKRILFFLRLWQFEKRYSPSNGEIASYFGVHRTTVGHVMQLLKSKGYIEMSQQKDWRYRTPLFPKGTEFPWGVDSLPDELFDYLRPENRKTSKQFPLPQVPPQNTKIEEDNGKELQNPL